MFKPSWILSQRFRQRLLPSSPNASRIQRDHHHHLLFRPSFGGGPRCHFFSVASKSTTPSSLEIKNVNDQTSASLAMKMTNVNTQKGLLS